MLYRAHLTLSSPIIVMHLLFKNPQNFSYSLLKDMARTVSQWKCYYYYTLKNPKSFK